MSSRWPPANVTLRALRRVLLAVVALLRVRRTSGTRPFMVAPLRVTVPELPSVPDPLTVIAPRLIVVGP